MTEKEQELSNEIARLTGQIIMARVVISLLFKLVAPIGGPKCMDIFRDTIRDFEIIPDGRSDDNFRREGFDHFKERLLQSFPSDDT